jgi:CubicO group peptidase (beta-lactamase class C family)
MKRIVIIICSLLSIYPAHSQKAKNMASRVDSMINPFVLTNNYSGTVLISQNGNVLLSKGYGKMSREYNLNNTTATKFMLASVSMIFTSAAIMKLNEEGKLSLSDSVSKYFPDYKHGNRLTVHDLLAQRSGIPVIGTGGNVTYDSMTKFEHSLEKLYSYFKEYDLLFTPGAQYNHGRSDYILLAYLIEKVSGKRFGQYLKEVIFTPLGMTNSGHYSSEKEMVQNLAKGYAPKDLYDVESAYQVDWSSRTGHASIYSTSADLQKFIGAALNGTFLKKDSWNKIFTDYGDNVGYGWFITKHLNRDRFQMNGLSPGFSSFVGFYPKERLIIIVLSNTYVALPPDLGKRLAALVLNEPFDRLNLTNKKVPADFAQGLTGIYKFDKNFYRPNYELAVNYENGHIISEWGGMIPIDKGDKNFKEYILRRYWSSVAFIENDKGEITEMRFDHHKGIKIK